MKASLELAAKDTLDQPITSLLPEQNNPYVIA